MITRNSTDPQHESPNSNARVFLEHFPPERRGPIANWFYLSYRNGARTPAALLAMVRQTCQRRQQWGDTADAAQVLEALDTDSPGALAYASYVIAYERLPYPERQHLKAERAFTYLKGAMQGKEPTPKQLGYLAALGYRGEVPIDRERVSMLIAQLVEQQRGRGRA